MSKPKILYAGDSPLGGAANYLAGILNTIPSNWTHIPPSEKLAPEVLKEQYNSIILSDFPKNQLTDESEKIISQQVADGTGLLMIGGWASFSGVYGNWKNSQIEKLLPVNCLDRDDRMNISNGALIRQKNSHKMFDLIDFEQVPVICGLNHVKAKPSGNVLLSASPIFQKSSGNGDLNLMIDKNAELPLFVINSDSRQKTAALTTDVAPHWCGGLVDWGHQRITLKVNDQNQVEVGNTYVQFLTNLLLWLSEKS